MLYKNLNGYRLILASRSPRRQQLLRATGLEFDVVIRDFDETFPVNLTGDQIAGYLSSSKIKSFRNEISANEIVLTADTIVWCNNRVLGKPADRTEAVSIIRELSANTHEVITGVSMLSLRDEKTFTESTRVTFAMLTDEEITWYVDRYKPFDKAGAYGIQEWIGITACSRIEGSYFNVVGLPVQRLLKELDEFVIHDSKPKAAN
jgi:septum formation protein